MRISKRAGVASAIAALAFMTMLLPAFAGQEIDQAANDDPATGFSELSFVPYQSFTPDHPNVRSIRVYLRADLSDSADVKLTLYNGGGTELASATEVLLFTFDEGWVDFVFAAPVTLVPGDLYIIGVGAGFDSSEVEWGYQTSPDYPDGTGASGFFFQTAREWDYLFEENYEDNTGPIITPHLSVPVQADNWYNTDVILTWTITDPESGDDIWIDDGCVDTTISVDQPITDYPCEASSTGGSSVYAPIVKIGRDTVKPTITSTPSIAAVNGWYPAAVTFTLTCTDDNSGIETDTVPDLGPFNSGASQSGVSTGTCRDNAGNEATPLTISGINVDNVKPTIVAAATTSPNSNGWYKNDVTVHFTCTDTLSGIPLGNCPADQVLNSEGPAVSSTAQTVMDLAGNVSLPSNIVTVKIDKTAPVVTLTPNSAPNGAGWYKTDVVVTTTGTDGGSAGLVCTTPQAVSAETAGLDIFGSCTDLAGNVGNGGPLNIKLDKTAPTGVTLTPSGALGDNGWYTSAVSFTLTGTDALSGIASCPAPGNLTTDTIGTLVTGTCTDVAGNTASDSKTIKIDTTDPTASMAVVFGTAGTNGWYKSAVTVGASGTDNVSGPVDCTPALQNYGLETAGQLLTAVCKNQAGRIANGSITVKIDMTAPVVTLTPSGTAGANGWFTSAVNITTTGTDALSGMNACSPVQTQATDTAGTVFAGSCTDLAGNNAGNQIVVKVDLSDPTAQINVIAGTLGSNGWYTSDVSMQAVGTDTISGPVTCVPPTDLVNVETAGHTYTTICTNQAGRTATTSLLVKVDKTGPVMNDLSFSTGAPNANGWSTSNITLVATATESISGPVVCDPIPSITTETGGLVVTGKCRNQAGLESTKSITVKLDLTDPTAVIHVTSGTPGANGWYTSDVLLEADGTDTLSGPVTCIPSSDFINFETIGHTFNTTCTNQAGRTATASMTVKVDKTGPVVSDFTFVTGTPNLAGWSNVDINLSVTATDTISPPAVCNPIPTISTETTGLVVTATCTNQAGLVTTKSITVKLDKTAPVASLLVTGGTEGTNGWYTSTVFVTALATDNFGVVFCDPEIQAVTAETPTAGITVQSVCTDPAGNSVTPTLLVKLDKTPPVTTLSTLPVVPDGDNDWFTSNVTIVTSCVETVALSVVPTAPYQVTVETAGSIESGTCTNDAGLSSTESMTIKLDKTAPTGVVLTPFGTLGNNGWYTSNVTVTTTGVEDISTPLVCTADQTFTTDIASQVVEGSCTNDAGLSTEATDITIKIDKTPPVLAPTLPATIKVGDVVTATPNATDAMSGIATSSCDAIVTTAPGNYTLTCTATDNAGNTTTTAAIAYVITGTVSGECGKILFGTTPGQNGAYGTFAFSCGSLEQLLAASGCSASSSVFYYNKQGGGFAVWFPGTTVNVANDEFLNIFDGTPDIEDMTIFTAKCS